MEILARIAFIIRIFSFSLSVDLKSVDPEPIAQLLSPFFVICHDEWKRLIFTSCPLSFYSGLQVREYQPFPFL